MTRSRTEERTQDEKLTLTDRSRIGRARHQTGTPQSSRRPPVAHMMYTITRGPSKLVTQRRTGPTQQVETKSIDLKLKPTSWLSDSPHPKIVFNRLKWKHSHGAATQRSAVPAEGFTPAHEENVRFVYEAWQEVEQKLGDGDSGVSTSSLGPVQYSEKTPSAAMKNFVPIDLDEWWAQRFLANIANLS